MLPSIPPATINLFDAIVVGGSFAGLSAATQLARARRNVLVIDGGHPRNQPASHSHGFLGFDGDSPSSILSKALHQLSLYPTAYYLPHTHVTSISNQSSDSNLRFVVTADTHTFSTRRVVLATGIVDELPPIKGLKDSWGRGVVHCPYCHAYEVSDLALGVLGMSAMSIHQAFMLTHWSSNITFFVGGYGDVDPIILEESEKLKLVAMGIKINYDKVVAIVDDPVLYNTSEQVLKGVELENEGLFLIRRLLVGPKLSLGVSESFIKSLGIETELKMQGFHGIKVGMMKNTSVEGVFAAGEATGSFNIATSVADGSIAGAGADGSLLQEEIKKAIE
ncbi:hypothetical protein HK096_010100 [Nowakowskiella sp. JEL0078]|nr:hypothetical protein HK096_010100 [Nowakowskiella sp. JEL0078]